MAVGHERIGRWTERGLRGSAAARAARVDARIGPHVGARDRDLRPRLLDALGGGAQVVVRRERFGDEAIEHRILEERPPLRGCGRRGLRDAEILRQVDVGAREIRADGAGGEEEREDDWAPACAGVTAAITLSPTLPQGGGRNALSHRSPLCAG